MSKPRIRTQTLKRSYHRIQGQVNKEPPQQPRALEEDIIVAEIRACHVQHWRSSAVERGGSNEGALRNLKRCAAY